MSVKIIVDSASDVTLQLAQANGLGYIPLKTVLGGVEYRDGIDILPDAFYEKLEAQKELAHTSQVNASEFSELFAKCLADGDELLVITLSSGLSGTYQSAVVAAAEHEGKVFVVDSRSATAGEWLLVKRAITLRDAGKSAREIYDELTALRARARLFVRVETLEYLKRGGRVSKTAAVLGGLLHIKPILTLNTAGTLESVGKARGNKASHKMLNDAIAACGGIDFSMPVVITYAGDVRDGAVQEYLADAGELFAGHEKELTIGQLGCVIGTHTGPGAIVISFIPKEN